MKHQQQRVCIKELYRKRGIDLNSNQDIRQAMKDANLSQWHVAHCYGVHENTFRTKLRFELNIEEKAIVFAAIQRAKKMFDK